MCKQYILRRWLCDHDIDLNKISCGREMLVPDFCPSTKEEILVDGNCHICIPNIPNAGFHPNHLRFPWPEELLDSTTLIAEWDKMVATLSPDDQKLFNPVSSVDQSTPVQVQRKKLLPKTRKSLSPAFQQAPLLAHYKDLSRVQSWRESVIPSHHETSPQYWTQDIFHIKTPKQGQTTGVHRTATQQDDVLEFHQLLGSQRMPEGNQQHLREEHDFNTSLPRLGEYIPTADGSLQVLDQQPSVFTGTQGFRQGPGWNGWDTFGLPQYGGYVG